MTTIAAPPANADPEPHPAVRPHWNWLTIALALVGLWAWAIAGSADEWRDNPMYSYGWFVPPLMIFFAWRRLDEPIAGRELYGPSRIPGPRLALSVALGLLAVLVLPVELLRNELPDDRLNNWGLAITAIAFSLWVAYCIGGARLVWTLAFPIAFFATAVAWPKRYESPVTVGLQGFVAGFVIEVMHMLGIQADPHGTTIYLRNGPVGIAEACSGIRSLQASLMISLAIGELFYLRLGRRLLLVVLCSAVAMALNLGRTLSLCLITEYQGAEAMHRAHDWIGNTILLLLPLLAWILGRLLAGWGGAQPSAPLPRRASQDGTPPPPSHWSRVWSQARRLAWGRMPNLAPALVIGVIGFSTYHVWLSVLDRRDPPQQTPFFTPRAGPESGIEKSELSPDIWAALSPTSGGFYVSRDQAPSLPGSRISLYHFFWKPAAANRWVTGHRPDVCMPAGGWKPDGKVEPIEVEFNGQSLRMTLFRFKGVGQRAIQLWGIWRNGQPIEMNFFENPTLEWSLLTGRSRSAVEVLSCVVPFTDGTAPVDLARELLTSAFEYRHGGDTSLADRAQASSNLSAAPAAASPP